MMMKQRTLILFACLLFFNWPGDASPLDNRMGQLYLEQARFFLENGELQDAWEFILKASEYIPESQDLRYVSTDILLRQGYIQEALAAAKRQYQEDQAPRKDWDRLRLPLLVRTKDYQEAADIYRHWGDGVDWNPEELLSLARAFAGLGDIPGMIGLVERALERYPRNIPLLEILLRHSRKARTLYRRKLLHEGSLSREREDELLLLLLPLENIENFPFLWEIYRERELFSLEGEVRRGELFGWKEGPPWESLVEGGLFKNGLLTQRIHRWLLFNDDLTAFNGHFAGFSGVMAYDYNRDGWNETAVSYRGGTAEEIHWDSLQYGAPQGSLFFESGVPKRLSLQNRNIQVKYHSYPWVEEVLYLTAGGRLRYRIESERYSLPLEWETDFSPTPLEVELDLEILERKALRVSFQPSDSLKDLWTAKTRWGGGLRRRFHPMEAGEGEREVFTKNGVVYREEGFFLGREFPDTVVRYQEGVIREISHDADGDGIFEYREEYSQPGEPPYYSILWDLDGNGQMDVGERMGVDGRRREYFLEEAENPAVWLPAGE